MNIALFGTSGDPPTIGHRAILQWLAPRFSQVVVWVSHNPFKSHHATLEQRMEMMDLTISSLFQCHNIALHPELSNPHTLVTVTQAKQMWQNANFTLVVGSDIVPQLPSWYRAAELLRQVEILVIPRQGYSLPIQGIANLKKYGAEVTNADLTVPIISSSQFRENGERSGVISTVATYIEQQQLYLCQEAKPSLP